MYVYLQSWSLNDDWAKYKEKVPDVSDLYQNVETTCNFKLNFTYLKYLFIKRVQKKLVTDELDVCTYVTQQS